MNKIKLFNNEIFNNNNHFFFGNKYDFILLLVALFLKPSIFDKTILRNYDDNIEYIYLKKIIYELFVKKIRHILKLNRIKSYINNRDEHYIVEDIYGHQANYSNEIISYDDILKIKIYIMLSNDAVDYNVDILYNIITNNNMINLKFSKSGTIKNAARDIKIKSNPHIVTFNIIKERGMIIRVNKKIRINGNEYIFHSGICDDDSVILSYNHKLYHYNNGLLYLFDNNNKYRDKIKIVVYRQKI